MTSNQHVSHCAAADLRKTLQCKKLSLWVKSHTHTHVAMKLKNRATTPVVSLPKGLQFKAATLYFRSQSQSNPFGRWSGKAGSQTPPVWTCFFYPDIYNYPTFFSADLLSVKCEFFFYLLRTALGEGPEATALPPPRSASAAPPPHPGAACAQYVKRRLSEAPWATTRDFLAALQGTDDGAAPLLDHTVA